MSALLPNDKTYRPSFPKKSSLQIAITLFCAVCNGLQDRIHNGSVYGLSCFSAFYSFKFTGGASGIGLALTRRLLDEGWSVCVADRDVSRLEATGRLYTVECDTSSWEAQVAAFQEAIDWQASNEGRINFVAPIAGIGERQWIPFPEVSTASDALDFTKPDLSVLNVDLTGVLYTIALAVQHFRRQKRSEDGLLGRIGLISSICGLYCVPSLPIYTAAKHALVGLTRSYGKLLTDEGITVNAVAPNVVRTNISHPLFYEKLTKENLLTPMDGLLDAFKIMIDSNCSGEIFECGPTGGWTKRGATEYLDKESEVICEMLNLRARTLHYSE